MALVDIPSEEDPMCSRASNSLMTDRTRGNPRYLAMAHPLVILALASLGAGWAGCDAGIDAGGARGSRPDRICLTWRSDPATTQAVSWRTAADADSGFAEIARADASPRFEKLAQRLPSVSQILRADSGPARFHEVEFDGLEPATLYAYRVGDGRSTWSEWFHFRTASHQAEPFTFIYFGDAQNSILSLWSRAIRSAFSDAPRARLMLHAGDLVNSAESDREWGEWFDAGSFIHAMVPAIPVPGNHEYATVDDTRRLSHHWRPTFALPLNGPAGLEESVYWLDVQDVRFVVLNSNEQLRKQAQWLDGVLQANPNRWTVVTHHHPLFSSAKGRDNQALRELFKPRYDRYGVDLVLQGHDHSYARGRNLPTGAAVRDSSGTMYVVSVSGPKMYQLTEDRWMARGAENTQLYQLITIDTDTLRYRAVTVTGELYDAFELHKQADGPNRLVDRVPATPERRFSNTLE